MADLHSDSPTPINTSNNSSVALKALVHEDKFLSHPIYTKYQALYADHLEKNKSNSTVHDVIENIKPMLTGHTLAGPDKISFRSPSSYIMDPIFLDTENPASVDAYGPESGNQNSSFTFFHLGEGLTGHKSIIHGGLLATILDELACRLAFLNFPSKMGVTANLNITYKRPCFVNNYILVRCDVSKKEGRKCSVNAKVYLIDLDSDEVEVDKNLLTECECLVIEPKWVKELNNH
ncbi:hypothetical protein CLIB1423_01S05226 [[Candida] railenensis]|uniref:Thioesterase domain-containing protein n=1 Tax=[Candida] railenensis TaxID=45579 RepID=A0A9P0QKJ8_9ASCO|nr:hypothetical protein CLIB1423_01S05226 [[Candida] railenensis]